MIAVIFEVWPSPGQRQTYLDIAASLRPQLEKIDGFISVERFESLTEPGKMLSLSFSATKRRSRRGATSKVIGGRRPRVAPASSQIIGCGLPA
jgi:heme-degrading monooxygenase HmoA